MRDRKSNKAPSFTVMHFALLLLCAVLVSSHATLGLYASYRSEATGSASARVIKFGDIDIIEADDNNLTLIPGVDGKKKAYVDFEGSESATYVFVRIDASAHWTREDSTLKIDKLVSLGIDSGWTHLTTENGIIVYYKQLAPNTVLNETSGNIFANDGKITVSTSMTYSDISNMKNKGDISITLKAYAVQSIGFADPLTAWNSVSNK